MGRRLRAAAAAAAALLCACDATLTETRTRVKGPVAEVGLIDAGAGRVRFALKGPGWLVAKRRKRAFKLMERYCGGAQYLKVSGERDAEIAETPYTEDDLDVEKFMERGHYRVDSFRVVEFECLKP
ncbi:MAG: hypothetical protein HY928_07735 [Elusimicrobia bacterium]|nr:hypothetical protein [Elusimicrobiota bacterium]